MGLRGLESGRGKRDNTFDFARARPDQKIHRDSDKYYYAQKQYFQAKITPLWPKWAGFNLSSQGRFAPLG